MTGWALTLGILGFLISLVSLTFSALTYRVNGPILRVKIGTALVADAGSVHSRLIIEVTNVGRAPAEIARVSLQSMTSTAWTSVHRGNAIGPELPTTLAPTATARWQRDYHPMKAEILASHPGEAHSLRGEVRYGTRRAVSRQRVPVSDEIPTVHRTRRERVKSLLTGRLQLWLLSPQPRLSEGLQKLDVVNHGSGPAFDVKIDLLEHNVDGTRTVIEEVATERIRVLWGRSSKEIYMPFNVEPRSGGELFWRVRSRSLFGRGEHGQGFSDAAALRRLRDSDFDWRGWDIPED